MNKMLRPFLAAAVGISMLSTACNDKHVPTGERNNYPSDVVNEWNEIAFRAFDGPVYQHSLEASRLNAVVHIAMHDAVNAVDPRYKAYAFNGRDADADPVAAAASAAHTVLVALLPAKNQMLDSSLQESLKSIGAGNARDRGVALGKQAAAAILQNRANDGAAQDPIAQVPVSNQPGVYQAVPPFNFLFAPHWENVKLFGLERKDQFRPAPQPALNSTAYAEAFEEVKSVGMLNSTTRTADQSAYAKYWYEFSEAGWNRVARTVSASKKLNLHDAARLFALVDMALADAYIAGWDAKIHYNFWRPYTAIRAAANDGNDATAPVADWEPSEPTPPVHDYPSTHSALGNAAATVLARLLGDQTPFTMTSFTAVPKGAERSFNSFSQAADENADSRVMAGIHFRFSCEAGQGLGDKIGNWVVDNHLQPLK
jgi:hypothetical protein